MHAIRNWQLTPLAAPRQCPIHTNPRSAAYSISTAQDFHPNVWLNSRSGIGSAVTLALCNNRSCPASGIRFAVWSNSSSWIASNTASGAASRCPIFISSDGERDGTSGARNAAAGTMQNIWHQSSINRGFVILRCRDGTCGGARICVDQALAWCGEWCGLPNPDYRHCAFATCSAYQISANTEQKWSLAWS